MVLYCLPNHQESTLLQINPKKTQISSLSAKVGNTFGSQTQRMQKASSQPFCLILTQATHTKKPYISINDEDHRKHF